MNIKFVKRGRQSQPAFSSSATAQQPLPVAGDATFTGDSMQTKRWRIAHSRSPKRCRRGAAIIETAIGFTVLIVLMFGVLEMALYFQDHELLTNITREYARRMAIGSTTPAAKTKALQWNMGNSRFTDANVTLVPYYSQDGGVNWYPFTSTTTAIPTNYWVRVQGTYRHYNLTRFFGAYSDLHATSAMRVENGS
jgi:Flp pilus assembly protein TadG